MFHQCTKWNNWSFKWFSDSSLIKCLPDKRFCMFRRWVKHSMESAHHFSTRPDCNNSADVPYLCTPTNAPNSFSGPLNDSQIFVHFEISLCFGHSAHCNTTPWNLTTTFYSIQIEINTVRSVNGNRTRTEDLVPNGNPARTEDLVPNGSLTRTEDLVLMQSTPKWAREST